MRVRRARTRAAEPLSSRSTRRRRVEGIDRCSAAAVDGTPCSQVPAPRVWAAARGSRLARAGRTQRNRLTTEGSHETSHSSWECCWRWRSRASHRRDVGPRAKNAVESDESHSGSPVRRPARSGCGGGGHTDALTGRAHAAGGQASSERLTVPAMRRAGCPPTIAGIEGASRSRSPSALEHVACVLKAPPRGAPHERRFNR